jgi:hypothetical protein
MSHPTGNPVAFAPVSQRQVRIPRPVVQAFMRAVFQVRHDLVFGRPVGAQFVGDRGMPCFFRSRVSRRLAALVLRRVWTISSSTYPS